MSFDQPLALLGLLVLPLLVALYLWRAQHRRQVVSSTWLWSEALAQVSHQPIRRLPVREPLLLLQLLAAALLSLLLAAPHLDRTAHLRRIVVLDDSIAMSATDLAPSRFAQAQRAVLALLDATGAGDTFSLILAGPRARLVGETPGADLRAALQQMRPSAGAADLSGAAALARGLASTPGRGIPRVTFVAASETPALSVPGVPVQIRRFGRTLDDRGISVFSVRCLPDGHTCSAFARLRNTAGAARTVTLALWADGTALGRQTLQVAAAGTLDLTFAVPPGAHTLRLSLAGHDALAADDSAWAIVPTAPGRRVLLVSDTPTVIARALRAIPGVRLQVIPTASYQDMFGAAQDLVVLDGLSPEFLPASPLLLLDPSPDSSIVQVRAANAFLPVSQVDVDDPIVAGLDLYGLTVSGRSLAPPPWGHVAAGGAAGPLVLYGVYQGQPTAVLPFNAAAGSVAQSDVFPLLIARLVNWLAPVPPPSVPPGASVHLPLTVTAILDPAGHRIAGPLVQAEMPGLYRVAAASDPSQVGIPLFSVPPGAPGDASGVAPAFPRWSAPAGGGSLPQPAWPAVLVVALAALLAEWWAYARRT